MRIIITRENARRFLEQVWQNPDAPLDVQPLGELSGDVIAVAVHIGDDEVRGEARHTPADPGTLIIESDDGILIGLVLEDEL
jgi:hypothetical protein